MQIYTFTCQSYIIVIFNKGEVLLLESYISSGTLTSTRTVLRTKSRPTGVLLSSMSLAVLPAWSPSEQQLGSL